MLLLIKAGDVETNPDSTISHKRVWICNFCYKQIHVRKKISTLGAPQMRRYPPSTIHRYLDLPSINDIKEWLSSNSNGLNQNNHLVIGNTVIDTQSCVTNLCCVLDVGLVMSGHAARMCKSAYHHLHCIRKIRNCIPIEV